MGCMDSVEWNGGVERWNGMERPDKRNGGRVRPSTLKIGRIAA